jgi:hypothetical protein
VSLSQAQAQVRHRVATRARIPKLIRPDATYGHSRGPPCPEVFGFGHRKGSGSAC